MSRFGGGLQVGQPVRQKQVIGYVGSTGLSTGPHVCFRVTKDGEYVDPARLRTPAGDSGPRSTARNSTPPAIPARRLDTGALIIDGRGRNRRPLDPPWAVRARAVRACPDAAPPPCGGRGRAARPARKARPRLGEREASHRAGLRRSAQRLDESARRRRDGARRLPRRRWRNAGAPQLRSTLTRCASTRSTCARSSSRCARGRYRRRDGQVARRVTLVGRSAPARPRARVSPFRSTPGRPARRARDFLVRFLEEAATP